MRRPWSLALVVWMGIAVVLAVMGPARIPAQAGDETPTHIGADACKKCHFAQHKGWSKSKLSEAFNNLKPGTCDEAKTKAGLDPATDYSTDPKCLKCHTTAYGQASGYPEVVADQAFTDEEKARAALTAGVTCEACHGPGSLFSVYKKANKEYKRAEIVKLGAISPPTAETCAPCHVKECPTMPDDYKFDFEAVKDSEKVHPHKPLKYKHD